LLAVSTNHATAVALGSKITALRCPVSKQPRAGTSGQDRRRRSRVTGSGTPGALSCAGPARVVNEIDGPASWSPRGHVTWSVVFG
jgi:hypothetical protein